MLMMVTSPGTRLFETLCFRELWAGQSSARSGPMRRGQGLEWFTFSVPSKGPITSFKGSVKRMVGKLKPYASGRSDVRRGNAPSLPWGCAAFKGQWCEWYEWVSQNSLAITQRATPSLFCSYDPKSMPSCWPSRQEAKGVQILPKLQFQRNGPVSSRAPGRGKRELCEHT